MLSILIPTYNYNITVLAHTLFEQVSLCGIPFEILVFDDGSNSELNIKNAEINNLPNTKFIAQKKNVGLSNNRNALAEAAKYNYYLFIDGDSLLPDSHFISRYLESIHENVDVVYGGRIHPETVEPERKLRWKYGIYREDLPANERLKKTYKCVLFNNTVISKTVFEKIRFEKTIIQYGHEDTIFAYHLSLIEAHVIHIDNPVIHGDVDFNTVFFDKTHKSIENLNFIYKNKLIAPDFVTFLILFNKLKRFKLNYPLALIHTLFYTVFSKNLKSDQPSLFVFDMFRLSYFCSYNLKK
ncbi:glycosyltransferase family 2 protein [Algibacter miyuki]|uniref:Glycosyltransferase family 2 protein n=1 Tax=Algibacter miyuki TaxID=1306933 RepID=A0ABV5GXX4_9FLAO|nr:glycosyltransferase family 2 protein [Algibacter miyuki]MDN3665899.1 glycosyltransferase family 2 protein [Algibacter miyuki]